MSNYFLKKGEKAFGPFTWDRLEALAASGKIDATDSISTSSKGPWRPFSALQAEMAAIVSDSPDQSDTNFLQGFPMEDLQQPVAASQPRPPVAKPVPQPVATDQPSSLVVDFTRFLPYFWLILSIGFFVVAFLLGFRGFMVSFSKPLVVGGDAYNYIIGASRGTAQVCLAIIFALAGVACSVFSLADKHRSQN
jgi:hypothetical protein